MIATVICVVSASRLGNPLDYTGPNLASNQIIVQPSGLTPGPNTGPPAPQESP